MKISDVYLITYLDQCIDSLGDVTTFSVMYAEANLKNSKLQKEIEIEPPSRLVTVFLD